MHRNRSRNGLAKRAPSARTSPTISLAGWRFWLSPSESALKRLWLSQESDWAHASSNFLLHKNILYKKAPELFGSFDFPGEIGPVWSQIGPFSPFFRLNGTTFSTGPADRERVGAPYFGDLKQVFTQHFPKMWAPNSFPITQAVSFGDKTGPFSLFLYEKQLNGATFSTGPGHREGVGAPYFGVLKQVFGKHFPKIWAPNSLPLAQGASCCAFFLK